FVWLVEKIIALWNHIFGGGENTESSVPVKPPVIPPKPIDPLIKLRADAEKWKQELTTLEKNIEPLGEIANFEISIDLNAVETLAEMLEPLVKLAQYNDKINLNFAKASNCIREGNRFKEIEAQNVERAANLHNQVVGYKKSLGAITSEYK